MIAIIDNYRFDIEKNNKKNMHVGTCISDNTVPTFYGDTVSEVIEQAEEYIMNRENSK